MGNPTSLETFAIDDVSEACRKAGAAAVLCNLDLLKPIAQEQEAARGGFPSPLPVVVEVAMNELAGSEEETEFYGRAKSLGASGLGICYNAGDLEGEDEDALEETLRSIVAAAEKAGLGTILLPGFARNGDEGAVDAGGLASRVGAAAGLART